LGKREPINSAVTGEIKKVQVEKTTNNFMSALPEIKLSYKIEYAKDFLDKKTIDKNAEPDILKVSLQNLEATVTVVETNIMLKVVAVGFTDGRIKAYYFYEEAIQEMEPEKPIPKFVKENEPERIVQKSNLQTILETDIKEVVDEMKECTFLGHSGAITSISLSYDSFYMISGSADCTIRLWSLKVGQCLAVFKAHIKSVLTVKLSPKGFHFASGGSDSLIFLWLTNKSKFH